MFRKPKPSPPLVGWRRETIEQVIHGLEMSIIRALERHAADGGTTGERVGWYRAVWEDRKALIEMLAEIDKARENELKL